ncbi:MAG: Crp/Fnr family transcriptional regulator [Bacteroidetes bacterium]|uniref:Crp/Fnr family transcriptional regulator n=1 Tax=Candidatus Merdivivens pullistercoris TaxID=2840873 RepID=A0A9D9N9D2_9BACT|nr:Crp/Fnr family transcriptional regulator [Candidatus Merdivivens pullistercoris]
MSDFLDKFLDEGSFRLPEQLAISILSKAEDVHLGPKDDLVRCGKMDSNVYIVSEGILRMWYFDGDKEVTLGFTDIGTIFVSLFGYFRHLPAFISVTACTKCVVKKIPKDVFDGIVKESHVFSNWIYSVAIHQLFASEMKLSLINGTAKDRYVALIKNRPDIIMNVPMKTIASYLGVSPSYLCKVKRSLK